MREMSLGVLHEDSDGECADDTQQTADGAVRHAPKQRTKKDRARRQLHRQAEAGAEARRSLKRLRRQLENVGGLKQEIEHSESERALRAARRQVRSGELWCKLLAWGVAEL